jgi:hypothetical protein
MPNWNVGEVAAFPGLLNSLIYCTELQQGDGFYINKSSTSQQHLSARLSTGIICIRAAQFNLHCKRCSYRLYWKEADIAFDESDCCGKTYASRRKWQHINAYKFFENFCQREYPCSPKKYNEAYCEINRRIKYEISYYSSIKNR